MNINFVQMSVLLEKRVTIHVFKIFNIFIFMYFLSDIIPGSQIRLKLLVSQSVSQIDSGMET